MRRRLALFALVVSSFGCAPSSTPAKAPANDAAVDLLAKLPAPLRAAFRDVARVRGLALRRPVNVHALSGAAFEQKALATGAASTQTAASGDDVGGAFLEAFAIALPKDARASGEKLTRESLAGYYASNERALFVRSDAPAAAKGSDDDEVSDTLTHEIVHAVQDDHFPFAALAKIEDADAMLAARAVYEGDATVSAWAVAADRAGGPIEAAIRSKSAANLVSGLASQALLHLYAPELEIANVPAFVRDRLTFPYWGGAYFVAEVHRTGGFALVDRVLGRLPDTTEQVLHPEKYFSGEGAIDIDVPRAPAGYTVVSTGSMGELQTRALLGGWASSEEAIGGATGWGGDRYAVVRAPGKRAGVVWISTWDDEESATRFAKVASRAPGARVKQEGKRVAFVRNVDVSEALFAALFEMPEHPRRIPPALANVDYRETTHLEREADERGTYRDAQLGLALSVPPGLERVKPTGHLTLMLRGTAGVRAIGIMWRAGQRLDERLLAALRGSIAPTLASMNLGFVNVQLEGEGERALLVGRARTIAWRAGDDSGRVRMTLVPICDGADTLLTAEFAFNEEARVALDRWVSSMEPMRGGLTKRCTVGAHAD